MRLIADHPEIRCIERTGYPSYMQDDYSDPTPTEPIYITEDGEMSKREAIRYMCDYVRTNPEEAAEAFGIEVKHGRVY